MRVKLKDICEKATSNLKQSDILSLGGKYPVYGASGYLGNIDSYHQDKPYIAVVKDGAGIGRTTILPPKSSVIGTMQYLIPKENVMPEYLYYVVKHMRLQKYYTGATIPHIYFKDYQNEEFNLADLNKQREIVKVLKNVDNTIRYQEIEINKFDELIKARFIEMFGDININNKNWHTEHLGKLCNIVRGSSPRPIEKYLGGDIPWIKIGDATDEDNIYLNSTKEHIIREGVNKSRFVKKGSLIFANCGVSLGFARIISFDGCIHDGWLALENIDYRLNKEFLLLSLNQLTDHFRIIAPSGTQPNLNIAIMQNFMQVIPPMELQETFVSFRRHVDKSREEVKRSLEKTQQLYDSLMQEYFG